MSGPLLATKLYIPHARPSLVPRARLTTRVSEGLTRPLTLIAAPAGFGKTTLISQWRAGPGRQFPLAWLSLDDDDNDPTRFLTYLIATLETLRVGIGERALTLVQSLQPQPPKVILTILINDLTAMPTSFAVVLDDYHAIHAQTIHDAIAFLLDHLPPQMHLIITSRADPPLALARLRASNLLTEIRADDLRFTREEVATFLNQIIGQDLSAADVAVLADRTEGWIAGLQLAALSMGGQTDATNFIAAFAGSHQYVVDYLTEEAVRLLPESVQSFLLHTSILDRMCAPLCDAVTGQSGSQAVLEELERMNMFTIRLDDAHRWYRYHHLFAEMLRNRLRRAHSDRVLELHRRASAWYEGQEFRAEAVRHALAGRDFERAAHLVEESAKTTFWMRGEVATLRGWLEALPDALVSKHPRLSLLYAWTLLLSGQSAAVEPLLQETERRLARSLQGATEASAVNSPVMSKSSLAEIRGWRGEMAAIRARVARVNDDLPRSIALCHMALEYLPPQDLSVRGLVALNLGIAYRHSGDVVAAAEALAEASAISEPAGNLFATLVALGQLANLEAEQGRLRQAASTYRCALAKAVGHGEKPVPAAAWAAVGLGDLMRQWNELDAASHHMLEGLELATQWGGNADGLAWAHMNVARLKVAQGKVGEASDALLEAEQVARHSQVSPLTLAHVTAYQARRWIDQGNIAATARWAQERGVGVEDELTYLREQEHLALARLLIAERKLDVALRLLERLLRFAEEAGLTGTAIEALGLQCLTLQAQGKTPQALITLARALSLAEPEGYVRIFVDEGPPMATLLHLAESRGVVPAYVRRILAAFGDAAPVGSAMGQLLVDPLSERELEILRLVAAGLSTPEIADTLVIAVGTVRNHVKNIYGKLDAHSRVQAVERARMLHVL